jgi:hypothetical protein
MGLAIPSSNKFRLGNEYSYRGTDAYCGDLFPLVRERSIEMTRALLQQALDALIDQKDNTTSLMQVEDAITAIREYLAQPEQEQKPVAWFFPDDEEHGYRAFRETPPPQEAIDYLAKWNRPAWIPLYTKEQL